MEEMAKHGRLGLAAARSGMDRKTARKYAKEEKFPSELEQERTWRTREDPFEEQWAGQAERLKEAPELEAKTLFEKLCTREPGRYKPGQLRTLQRRVRQWRAQQGPERLVFFAQEHRPGEAMQTDFTWASELGVTVGGQPAYSGEVEHSFRAKWNTRSGHVEQSERQRRWPGFTSPPSWTGSNSFPDRAPSRP